MGVNVVLDKAEASKEFKSFQDGLQKAIKSQVQEISDDQEFVDQLLMLTVKADINRLVVSMVVGKMTPLNEMFDKIKGAGSFFSFFMFAGKEGGQGALDKLGVEAEFEPEDDELTNFLRDRSNLLVESVDETTAKRVSELLLKGRQGLLTNYEIAELLASEFDDISMTRAEMIARTELANAVSAVDLETMRRNGRTEKRWVTVIDERVCPICQPLHNEKVQITGDFKSDGDRGYIGQRPPAHVNCRCFLEDVITGFEPELQTFEQAQADPTRGARIVWTG